MKISAQNESSLSDVCPAQEAWDVISGKWKPCIIHVLANETMRFNQLKRNVPGITQRMLTMQLRQLEADGFVVRHHTLDKPLRVDYELTGLGHSVLPVFTGLTAWWTSHRREVLQARENYSGA